MPWDETNPRGAQCPMLPQRYRRDQESIPWVLLMMVALASLAIAMMSYFLWQVSRAI